LIRVLDHLKQLAFGVIDHLPRHAFRHNIADRFAEGKRRSTRSKGKA
jgi:hypothetical protein